MRTLHELHLAPLTLVAATALAIACGAPPSVAPATTSTPHASGLAAAEPTPSPAPPSPTVAPAPCALALEQGIADVASGAEVASRALTACGATDVRSSAPLDGRIVRGEIAGVSRAVLIVPGAMGEVQSDTPLVESRAWSFSSPTASAHWLQIAYPANELLHADGSRGLVFFWTGAALAVRTFACASGVGTVEHTVCGQTLVCGSAHRVMLTVDGDRFASDGACLAALGAVQDAVAEVVARSREPWDAMRAPAPACTPSAEDVAAVDATLRAALGDAAVDAHGAPGTDDLGCPDADGARLVLLDRSLTTQALFVVAPPRTARPVALHHGASAVVLPARFDLDGDGATDWLVREDSEIDEGEHTTSRCFVVGPGLARPLETPLARPSVCSRAVRHHDGVGFLDGDHIVHLEGRRLVAAPRDAESDRLVALHARFHADDDALRTIDDMLIDPPISPVPESREYPATRVASALVDLGIEPGRARALARAAFELPPE